MVNLKNSEMRIIDDAFIGGDYVLDFSNRTFSEFFEDEFGLDIYDEKYGFLGTSKGNHLRALVKAEGPVLVSHVLRTLWKYFEDTAGSLNDEDLKTKARLFELLGRIEAGVTLPAYSAPQRAWTAEELALREKLKAYFDGASEDELTEGVLLPLFRQLGFQRTTPAGHDDKALEYGKDVWMKYRLPTTHELYFGLQVKKGKLDAAGRSKTDQSNIAEIHNQVLMMLGHPVFDPENNKKHLVDHAIIVAGGEITKQARNWIGEKLDASQRCQILFMDRGDILDLLLVHKVPLPAALMAEPTLSTTVSADDLPFA